MRIINKFHYPEITQVTPEDSPRYYVCPETGNSLPSVTSILSATSDMSWLDDWKSWIGEKKAAEELRIAGDRGSLLHENLECYVQGLERPRGNNYIRVEARRMADVVIDKGLPAVDEIWGIEIPLYFPHLYAGTSDLVGVHNGEPSIMDYKTSKKIKKKESIENYFCQSVAYALSHNYHYDTNIRKAVIMMVALNLDYEEFIIEGNEFDKYADIWMDRLSKYHSPDAA